jgi:hypothetical protein
LREAAVASGAPRFATIPQLRCGLWLVTEAAKLFRLGLSDKLLELGLEGVVLGALALEEARGDAGLGLDAFWGEQVGVGALVLAGAEVLGLEPVLKGPRAMRARRQ